MLLHQPSTNLPSFLSIIVPVSPQLTSISPLPLHHRLYNCPIMASLVIFTVNITYFFFFFESDIFIRNTNSTSTNRSINCFFVCFFTSPNYDVDVPLHLSLCGVTDLNGKTRDQVSKLILMGTRSVALSILP